MNPHLIDGLLSRSLFVFAFILIALPLVSALHNIKHPFKFVTTRNIGHFLLVLAPVMGLIPVILGVAEYDEQNKNIWKADIYLLKQWTNVVLLRTSYGETWLWHGLLAVLFICIERYWSKVGSNIKVPAIIYFPIGVFFLARLGHGLSYPIWSIKFISLFLHLVFVLLWLSSLVSFAIKIFERKQGPINKIRFLRTMALAMSGIILFGFIHSLEVWSVYQKIDQEPYLWVFSGKMILILATLILAFIVRRKVNVAKTKNREFANVKNYLGIELMLGFSLIFVSALLSQLAQPW